MKIITMVKKGEIGELCLFLGPLVGKGYHNDKKNTSKNFISIKPFE